MSPAPPLVLLHGLGQSPIVWQDFVSAFGAGRGMNAPWMPGLRPKDAVGFDISAAAAGIADELELQGIKNADVLGVSVGANVALRLALERPELVGRVLAASAFVRPTKGELRMQKLALRLVPESKLIDAGVSRPRMLAVFDALKALDGPTELSGIRQPTMIVAGAKDRVGRAGAQTLTTTIPGSRMELVEGAGTMLNTDAPSELARLAHEFFVVSTESAT